jgi:hypothetical protein
MEFNNLIYFRTKQLIAEHKAVCRIRSAPFQAVTLTATVTQQLTQIVTQKVTTIVMQLLAKIVTKKVTTIVMQLLAKIVTKNVTQIVTQIPFPLGYNISLSEQLHLNLSNRLSS